MTVATARSALPLVAGHAPELMTEALSETAIGALGQLALGDLPEVMKAKTVIAIGPGLGRHIETASWCAMSHSKPPCLRSSTPMA